MANKADEMTNYEPLWRPKSRAKDYMGFSHDDNFQYIQATNLKDNWKSYIELVKTFMNAENNVIFFHNYVSLILFKKIDNPISSKDLRGIGKIPAWLMTRKKLLLPKLKELIIPYLTHHQYGELPGKNTTDAKFKMFFNARYLNMTKAALLDLEKAFDSVNRKRLKDKLIRQCSNHDFTEIAISMLKIDETLMYCVADEIISPEEGLI